jgi:hypothetical protein
MSLKHLVDNSRTDKDTTHSYLDLYDILLSKRKEKAKYILEKGIYYGGSIKLWADYFTYATIYGLDTMPIDYVWNGIRNKKNIILHTSTNAYDEEYFNYTLLQKNIKFDTPLQSFKKALLNNTTLTTCKLGNTKIEYEDANSLAEVLKNNTTLTKLSLNIFDSSPIGLTTLRNSLNIDTSLTINSVNDFNENQATEEVKHYKRSFKYRNKEKETLEHKGTISLCLLAPELPTEIANLISQQLLITEHDADTLHRIGHLF